MNRNRIIIALVALLVVAGLGAVLYNRVLGESQAASGPITAIPLTAEASTAARPASEPADPAATVPEPAAASTPAPDAPAPGGLLRYRIVPEESQVRFTLSEVLRGQPTEVVGVSNQVAGELAVDPDDLSTAQVGVIQVNARTLETDNAQRNRAIRRFILETDTHEFITFTPTAIEGLSGSGGLGQPFTFTIHGDLTIRDVTRPVAFEATVQAESPERLVGTATAVINRADFNLAIPSVPFVADVSEQVTLAIDFVAQAVSS